jgi:hypothetical protein
MTVVEKKLLIQEMSLACYTLGEVYNQLALKLRLEFGKQHEEDCQPKELWVKPGIREIMP